MSKLNEGDIIQVNGWVMLSGLDSGKYKVHHLFNSPGGLPAYAFVKYPRGKKQIGHYVSNVDGLVENKVCLNNITIIKRA
jgi:hypothetical protein